MSSPLDESKNSATTKSKNSATNRLVLSDRNSFSNLTKEEFALCSDFITIYECNSWILPATTQELSTFIQKLAILFRLTLEMQIILSDCICLHGHALSFDTSILTCIYMQMGVIV